MFCQANWTSYRYHNKIILIQRNADFISASALIIMNLLSLNICYVEHKQRKTKAIKNIYLFAVAYTADGWLCLQTLTAD